MHDLSQLQKQQVGLRLPKYLVEEIDLMTKRYNLNRTDIITEALKSYLLAQKEKIFYKNLKESAEELSIAISQQKDIDKMQTLDELINELEDN